MQKRCSDRVIVPVFESMTSVSRDFPGPVMMSQEFIDSPPFLGQLKG